MQHRIRVGSHFYSVTVIGEDQNTWLAMAEVPGGWLVKTGTTRKSALDQWQAAAGAAMQQQPAKDPNSVGGRSRAGAGKSET